PQYRAHEVDLRVLRLTGDRRRRCLGADSLVAAAVQQAEHGRGADAHEVADTDDHQRADDPEVYPAEAASRTALVLDIIAAAAVIKLHGRLLGRCRVSTMRILRFQSVPYKGFCR